MTDEQLAAARKLVAGRSVDSVVAGVPATLSGATVRLVLAFFSKTSLEDFLALCRVDPELRELCHLVEGALKSWIEIAGPVLLSELPPRKE